MSRLRAFSAELKRAGMHEALISELARSGVPVLAATAVRQFADTSAPTQEIAETLGVSKLIEASILRVGDSVRVQARLVEATTQEHLWVRTYDGDLRDVLGLHRRLTREIADAVHVALTSDEQDRLARARRVNPEVYDQYLRGMHALTSGDPDGPAEAIRHLRAAIDLDPACSTRTGTYPARVPRSAARSHWTRARRRPGLARDPRLGAWPLAFAYAHAGRRAEALALLERLESDPRGPVHWGMAEVYAALGENEQALRSLELAYEQRFNY